jgi:hypothetical protein
MAHGVRADVFGYAGKQCVLRNQSLDAPGSEAVKIAATVDGFAPTVPYK